MALSLIATYFSIRVYVFSLVEAVTRVWTWLSYHAVHVSVSLI
jgi:hypothetical protein